MTQAIFNITMPDFARRVGVSYDRCYHAILTGVIKGKRFGKTQLFSNEQVEQLQLYFAQKDAQKKERKVGQ
jgi:hypothetical protein